MARSGAHSSSQTVSVRCHASVPLPPKMTEEKCSLSVNLALSAPSLPQVKFQPNVTPADVTNYLPWGGLVVSECLRGEQSAGLRRWRSGFTDQHVEKKPTVWMSSEKESLILLSVYNTDRNCGFRSQWRDARRTRWHTECSTCIKFKGI